MLKELPKDKTGPKSQLNDTAVDKLKPKAEAIKDIGFSQKQAERFQVLADNPDIIEQVKAEASVVK